MPLFNLRLIFLAVFFLPKAVFASICTATLSIGNIEMHDGTQRFFVESDNRQIAVNFIYEINGKSFYCADSSDCYDSKSVKLGNVIGGLSEFQFASVRTLSLTGWRDFYPKDEACDPLSHLTYLTGSSDQEEKYADEQEMELLSEQIVDEQPPEMPFKCFINNLFAGARLECVVVVDSAEVMSVNFNRGACLNPFATDEEVFQASKDEYFNNRLKAHQIYGDGANLLSPSGIMIFRLEQARKFQKKLNFGEKFEIYVVDRCNLIEAEICTYNHGCWIFANY